MRETRKNRRLWRLLALALAFALLAASCGGSDDETAEDAATEETTQTEDTAAPAITTTTEATAEGGAELDPNLPAVQEGAAQTGGTYGGTLRIQHGFAPTSLDPHTGSSGGDHHVLYSMYDRLVHFEFDGLLPTPGLAESWEFSDDGLTLTFNLRSGVTFHDGTPFNSEAVAFNIDRGQNHPVTTVSNILQSIESVDTPDELTAVLKLSRPDTGLLGILADRAGMMVSPTAAAAAEEQRLDIIPNGTGAFKLVSYAPGDRLILEQNQDYWQEGLPYLDGIEWIFITDEQAAINGVLADDLDMMSFGISGDKVEGLEGNDDVVISTFPTQGMDGCYMNKLDSPFADVQVRQAWNHAIDREGLNDILHFGFAEPVYLPIPTQHWAHAPDLVPTFAFDPARAQELLAEAGFADGLDISMVMWQNPHEARKAEVIQQAVAESGFNVEFQILEGSAANAGFFENGDFDIYCSGWSGRPDIGQTVTALAGGESFYNYSNVGVQGLDELIQDGVASPDQADRAAAYREVWETGFAENAVWVPLWAHTEIAFRSAKVNGYKQNLYGKAQAQFVWLDS